MGGIGHAVLARHRLWLRQGSRVRGFETTQLNFPARASRLRWDSRTSAEGHIPGLVLLLQFDSLRDWARGSSIPDAGVQPS